MLVSFPCHRPLCREYRRHADALPRNCQKQLLRRCIARSTDGLDAAGACGGVFEIRSAGNGRTAQDQSASRAGVDTDRGSDRSSITYGRLGATVPLPKGISPPVTEVRLSGLTKLLISRENELGLRESPCGGPREGRAGNHRDQCESSDKSLHHISPCLWTVRDFSCKREDRRHVPCIPQGNRLSVFTKEIRLGAALGPVISLDLLDKPTIERLILWFAQLAP
jgi:hypothetical protein